MQNEKVSKFAKIFNCENCELKMSRNFPLYSSHTVDTFMLLCIYIDIRVRLWQAHSMLPCSTVLVATMYVCQKKNPEQ